MTHAAAAALFAVIVSGATLPAYAADSKEFAAAIERFSASDPQSPETLNARLAYAAVLVRGDAADCRTRLDDAQSQLELVKANPVLDAVLPAGLARATDLDYQIHSARAVCASAEMRDAELRAALASAQRAVELYRDAYDAVSMVTMQFNASVAYHDLGESAAAIAALQEAIAMDREYGYADDAEDNYTLLLQWKNEDASPEQVDARMQDFPERSATLAFGWFPSFAEVKIESDYTEIADGEVFKCPQRPKCATACPQGSHQLERLFPSRSGPFRPRKPAGQRPGASRAGDFIGRHAAAIPRFRTRAQRRLRRQQGRGQVRFSRACRAERADPRSRIPGHAHAHSSCAAYPKL